MPTKNKTAKKTTSSGMKKNTKVAKKTAGKTTKKIVAVKTKQTKRKSKTIAAAKKHHTKIKSSADGSLFLKRSVYMFLSIVFGLLAATLFRLILEMIYIKNGYASGYIVESIHFLGFDSYLPSSALMVITFAGLLFGVWLGFWGWNAVYGKKGRRA